MNFNHPKIFITLLIALIISTNSMQIVVRGQLTCLQFEVDQIEHPMLFSYHMNPHIDEVSMVLYDKITKKIQQTGSDFNYRSFLQVKYNETGMYPICFQKKSARDATIQFDILDEQERMTTAGKEDVNKLSKRISEFLIDIRKTGWEFKQVLDQHSRMKAGLEDNEKKNYWIFATKMIVMAVVVVVQFYAVKMVFQ